jgi:hypothetical protein
MATGKLLQHLNFVLIHEITEILLKVAFNTVTLTLALYLYNPCIQVSLYCFFSMCLTIMQSSSAF